MKDYYRRIGVKLVIEVFDLFFDYQKMKQLFRIRNPYMIDEMAICEKALEFQGLFRISGAKNIFHFYGREIPIIPEVQTRDFIKVVEEIMILWYNIKG